MPNRMRSGEVHFRGSARGWTTQLRKNVTAVASRWRHCVRFDRPGDRTQASRTDVFKRKWNTNLPQITTARNDRLQCCFISRQLWHHNLQQWHRRLICPGGRRAGEDWPVSSPLRTRAASSCWRPAYQGRGFRWTDDVYRCDCLLWQDVGNPHTAIKLDQVVSWTIFMLRHQPRLYHKIWRKSI